MRPAVAHRGEEGRRGDPGMAVLRAGLRRRVAHRLQGVGGEVGEMERMGAPRGICASRKRHAHLTCVRWRSADRDETSINY